MVKIQNILDKFIYKFHKLRLLCEFQTINYYKLVQTSVV